MSLPSHGSNPNYLYDYYQIKKPKQLIDFSVNINPLGMPDKVKELWPSFINQVADYPDPQNKKLMKTLSDTLSIDQAHLLLGNGAAELISLLGLHLRNKSILIIQPTFSEYESVCRAHNCQINYYTIQPNQTICLNEFEQAIQEKEAVFLCNPNNPTGKYIKKPLLKKMANICFKHNCLFVIDEAFYDFLIDYDQSIELYKEYSNLIFLRSLTKIYSIAGLRLGYLVAHPSIIKRIQAYLPHWHINAIAGEVGQLCLNESEFVKETQVYITEERQRMMKSLTNLSFEVVESEVNYYLVRDQTRTDLQALFIYLLEQGIVLRHTVNFPGLAGKWLRVAVKTKQENSLFLEALKRWREIN